MSIPDALIGSYFELATDSPLDAANEILSARGPMEAKLRLAHEIVTMYCGRESADKAAEHFDRTVRRKELPESIPDVRVTDAMLKDGRLWIVKLICHCGFARTNAEARRLVAQGAVTLDGETVTDAALDISVRDGVILRTGKRNFARIRVV